jgi:hypothetical protein
VVRPEGLEPPAYWFEAKSQHRISNLAVGTSIANDYSSLIVFMHLRHALIVTLATPNNASMQGMGTKLGTAGSSP